MLRFSQNVITFINIILFIGKIVTKSPSISPVQLSYRPLGFRLFISWKKINLNQKNEIDEFNKSFNRPESEKAKAGFGGALPWISGNMEKWKDTLSNAGSGGALPCFLNKHNPVQGFSVVTDGFPCIFLGKILLNKVWMNEWISTENIGCSTLIGKARHTLGWHVNAVVQIVLELD